MPRESSLGVHPLREQEGRALPISAPLTLGGFGRLQCCAGARRISERILDTNSFLLLFQLQLQDLGPAQNQRMFGVGPTGIIESNSWPCTGQTQDNPTLSLRAFSRGSLSWGVLCWDSFLGQARQGKFCSVEKTKKLKGETCGTPHCLFYYQHDAALQVSGVPQLPPSAKVGGLGGCDCHGRALGAKVLVPAGWRCPGREALPAKSTWSRS